MCHDPHTLADGTVVACRNCELCRYNRVKDWAGRNIAQSKVSAASFAVTLTYGPQLDENRMPIKGRSDHIRAAVLTYSDVQKFLKYLRWLGYPCDYFITGELGGLKSRTHWHVIMHFRDRVPTHELGVNFSDRHVNERGQLFSHEVCKAWPHGFMFWKKAAFEDVFYNCKYILKDEGDEAAQRKPGMSKKPPIGAEYFLQWADKHVEHHLAPQKLEYWFPEIRKKDGTSLIFKLSGRTAEMFLQRFIDRWKEVHGDKPRPRSDLVDLFEKYGKVVTDEARMLLRQEFPRGESRQPMPNKAQWDAAKDLHAEKMHQRAQDRLEAWQNRWVREADGEERQRRQQVVEFEQFIERQEYESDYWEWYAQQCALGFEFVVGKGWVRGSAKPDTPLPIPARFQRERFAKRASSRAGAPGRAGDCVSEPSGPVGKWNRHYGTRPGNGRKDR